MRGHAREIRRPRNGSRSCVTRGKFIEVCGSVLQYRARVTFRRSAATLAATRSRVAFHNIDVEFLRWHELLQPFGNGNSQPLFFARAVEPVGAPRVSNEKHLIFQLRQGDRRRRAVYFDGAANELPSPPWDVAFRIGVDEYGGETLIGMRIEGLRAAEKT